MDLGSVTNVMEEPAVELPLLTGPALRRIVSSAIALELVRRKLQAASLTAGLG
jgi:hypothetical protein